MTDLAFYRGKRVLVTGHTGGNGAGRLMRTRRNTE